MNNKRVSVSSAVSINTTRRGFLKWKHKGGKWLKYPGGLICFISLIRLTHSFYNFFFMVRLTAEFQNTNASHSLIISMPPTTGPVDVVQETKYPTHKSIKDLEGPKIKLSQVLHQLKLFFCQANTPSIQNSYEIVDINEADKDEASSTSACEVEWSPQEPSRKHISFQFSWWGYRM